MQSDWYQIDYLVDRNAICMANDSTFEVLIILPSVHSCDHHQSYSEYQVCDAWEQHYKFLEQYRLNIPHGTKSWIGPSMYQNIPCEFGYEDNGVMQYFSDECNEYIAYHEFVVYHMFDPVRKGYQYGLD